MRGKTALKTLVMAAVLFGLAACEPEKEKGSFRFAATIEQPTPDAETKTYFVGEHWIYWDAYDRISMGGNFSTEGEHYYADLVGTTDPDYEDYNGVFISHEMDARTKHFLGLFPYNAENVIVGSGNASNNNFPKVQIKLPATQPYHASDTTFARNVFPMVAWYGGQWETSPYTPYNLDFHSLGCIVRLQVFNQSNTDKTIDNITITSNDGKKLSGMFDVVGYKSYDTVHVVPTSSASTSVTLGGNAGGISFAKDELRSFYLVLPAIKSTGTIVYNLHMDVLTTDGQHCQKNFQVKVRRNGITYLRALGITGWNATNGTAAQGLVGNGTKERPFKIYTTAELVYMRNAFNAASAAGGYANGHYAKINGQTLDGPNYYFRLMNTDTLTTTNWQESIKNFYCQLDYTVSESEKPAIVNNSERPLFDTIASGAVVHGITLNRTSAAGISTTNNDYFALISRFNYGLLEDCSVSSTQFITYNNHRFAGVCFSNYGTLRGCSSTAKLSCGSGTVSGICYENRGTIQGCFVGTPMTISAGTAAGICYENRGTVKDSYFATSITGSTASWGGIVYTNYGSVKHCYVSSTGSIATTKSVGGIVNTHNQGRIDYCWTAGPLRGDLIGGIAATVNNNNDTIVNCYCNRQALTLTNEATAAGGVHRGGGLVGRMSAGRLENSFVYLDHIEKVHMTGASSVVGGLVGSLTGGTVKNCYAYETSASQRNLYGEKSGSPTVESCFLVGGGTAETGYSIVTVASGDVATSNANLETMMTSLNANVSGYYKAWEKTTSSTAITVPHLAAY